MATDPETPPAGPPKPVRITISAGGEVRASVDGEEVDTTDLIQQIQAAAIPDGSDD